MLAVATASAAAQAFLLRAFVPTADTVTGQAKALADALAARPRAIVLDPVDYTALFAYLRAAHDAGTPVVLLQTPRDLRNSTFIASFVAPEQRGLDAAAARALAALLRGKGGPVIAFLSTRPSTGTAGASFAGLSRELRALLPTARLTSVELDAAAANTAGERLRELLSGQPAAIISVDARSTAYLAGSLTDPQLRPVIVLTTVDGQSAALLSESLVDVVVGPDMCELTRSAMSAAAAAARNEPAAIDPGPTVPARTYYRPGTLTGCR
jgi:ABC-type sugar transport system substrate-binding protein